MFLLNDSSVTGLDLLLLFQTDLYCFLLILSFMSNLLHKLLSLLGLLSFKLLDLHLSGELLLLLLLFSELLSLLLGHLTLHFLLVLYLFLVHLYAFKLLCSQLLLLLQLKVGFVDFKMVHYLNILHA